MADARIDLLASEAWYELSADFRQQLPYDSANTQVQLFAGYQHALYELAQGLIRLFPHKKSVAFTGGDGPDLEPALEQAAIDCSAAALTVHRSLDNIDTVGKDLIFVMAGEDDPVTGRPYALEPLRKSLQEKKIFFVSLSHRRHEQEVLVKPAPHELRILSLTAKIALVITGERYRQVPLLAPRLPFYAEELPKLPPFDTATFAEREKRVRDFEARLPTGFRKYFSESEVRATDQAVIYHPEHDGSALLELLGKPVAATSGCLQQNPKLAGWLRSRGEPDEVIRGLMIIDAAEIDATLPGQLGAAAKKLAELEVI